MPASLTRAQNGSKYGSPGRERAEDRGGRGRPHADRACAERQRALELFDRDVEVGEGDVRRREDAVFVVVAPVLLEPAVEGAEHDPDAFGVVLEQLLVDHAERRDRARPCRGPARPSPGCASRGRGTRSGSARARAGTRAGCDPTALPRKYSDIAPALAIGSNVGLTTAWLTLPPITWYLRPSISAHWMIRRPSRGIEVTGERVDRLVVVVVEVVDRVVDVAHRGAPPKCLLRSNLVGRGRPGTGRAPRRPGGRSAPGRRRVRRRGHAPAGSGRRRPNASRASRRPATTVVGRRRVDQLVPAPVLHRRRRRVGAVHVDLVVESLAWRVADPRPPDQHARAGAPGCAVVVDQLAAALGGRQRVEQQAGAEAGGAAHRGEPHRRARAPGPGARAQARDGGVVGEAARRRRRRGCPRAPRTRSVKRAARSSIGTCMMSKSSRNAPDATPRPTRPGEARRHPRDLLGDERGRSQRQQQRARRGPAGAHRLEAPAGRLQRVRQVAVEAAVVLAGHHAVESVPCAASAACVRELVDDGRRAGEVVVRIQPERDRAGGERCAHVRSACPRATPAARSSGWGPASHHATRAAACHPSSSAGNERGSPIITSNRTTPFGPRDERAEGVALVERDVRTGPAVHVAAAHVAFEHVDDVVAVVSVPRGSSCRGPIRRGARGSGARSRATSRAPTRCGRRSRSCAPPPTTRRRGDGNAGHRSWRASSVRRVRGSGSGRRRPRGSGRSRSARRADTRYTTAGPTSSSGSPTRPIGTRRESRSSMAGSCSIALTSAGEKASGDTRLTGMPSGAHSRARLLVKPRSAPFTVPYSGRPRLPSMPAGDVISTRVPWVARSASNPARAQWYAPRSDTAACSSQSDRSTSSRRCGFARPVARRVVHDRVQCAVARHREVDGVGDRRLVGDVAAHPLAAPAARFDLVRRRRGR